MLKILFVILLLSFLSACTPSEKIPTVETAVTVPATSKGEEATPPTRTSEPFPTPLLENPTTASPTRHLSATSRPTNTPQPSATVTPTPTPPPPTTTFDIASIVTRTPAPTAQCPLERSGLIPSFTYSNGTSEDNARFFFQIQDFLNSGGTRQAVITAYRQHYPRRDERIIREEDVTGDNVLDLLLTEQGAFVGFVCQNGLYTIEGIVGETYHFNQPVIIAIVDMNLNSVPEIISIAGDERVRIVDVSEWDRNEFRDLNWDRTGGFSQPCNNLFGPSWARAKDSDGNGTLELVLEQAIPIWSEYTDGLPWRRETRICSWNGEIFVHTHTELTPPEYRFQAIQDGDRAFLASDYESALDLYQQAIFSDKMDWWSEDRKFYEMGAYNPNFTIKPTPDSSLVPDPNEYFYLAAYARFRIALLHLVTGAEQERAGGVRYATGKIPRRATRV